MKVLIIEDDDIYASALEIMIEDMGYQVAGIANNPTEALCLFKATSPDLVLMDIQLRGGNGIDTARQMPSVPIIFVTAMQEDEIFEEAVKTDPFAYINKPVDRLALERSIRLAMHKYKNSLRSNDGAALHLKVGRQVQKVPIDSIYYLKVEKKQVIIALTDHQQVKVRMPLSKLTKLLPKQYFIQVHQSYTVNIRRIDKVTENCVQIGGEQIPISRRLKTPLIDALEKLKFKP
ncbi:LytTR family DNA-binding domain-containing protein [uncultured Microscilla sp.]|uniref:LytR/AlgR family response regulator transcription factor n=1 Tax=uncultured Microscilla sp. TaxID=432653 RepID=UPI002622962B|nr:response regulator transcription factor [uncultured Microscilla sp.]